MLLRGVSLLSVILFIGSLFQALAAQSVTHGPSSAIRYFTQGYGPFEGAGSWSGELGYYGRWRITQQLSVGTDLRLFASNGEHYYGKSDVPPRFDPFTAGNVDSTFAILTGTQRVTARGINVPAQLSWQVVRDYPLEIHVGIEWQFLFTGRVDRTFNESAYNVFTQKGQLVRTGLTSTHRLRTVHRSTLPIGLSYAFERFRVGAQIAHGCWQLTETNDVVPRTSFVFTGRYRL